MHLLRTLPLWFAFILIAWPTSSSADWINLSGAENARNIAEIKIEKDQVRIQLEIFVEDLMFFEELVPDSFFAQAVPGRPGLQGRQQIFAESVLQVVADGKKLPVTFGLIEPRMRIERPSPLAGSISPYTRRPIPGPPEDKRVLFAELVYPFSTAPQNLSFVPPVDENGLPEVSIGFVTYHDQVLVVDFRQLTAGNELTLDWDDPWYSGFAKRPLQRNIGSGMRTFLYIEPYEVRNEILVRVKDIMSWLDFDLRGDEYIEADEFNRVREQIAQFFMARENVLIDGQQLKPILDRTAFVESSMQRSRFMEIPEQVPLNTAMVGVIITYLTDGIPNEVETRWDLFSDRVQKVTARMTDPAGPFPYDLEPDDNILKWTNYLKTYRIPTVEKVSLADKHSGFKISAASLACLLLILPAAWSIRIRKKAGQNIKPLVGLVGVFAVASVVLLPVLQLPVGTAQASQMSEEDGKEILDSLLQNIYRAFDFREESDVYDKLAIFVSGDLLADLYLEQRKSLVVEQAGGAQAKVTEVAVEQATVHASREHPGAIDLKATWTAHGSVGHWGHIHTRQNRYDAILSVRPVDGAWKIIDLELLEEKRIF